MMKRVLHEANKMQNFVDDVIAYDQTINHHVTTLRDLFQRMKQGNLKTRPTKTRIGYFEVSFIGHVISQGQVRPIDENVQKVINAPAPRTKTGVRSLCGTIGLFRKFIPSCANWTKDIRELTKTGKPDVVNWTEVIRKL